MSYFIGADPGKSGSIVAICGDRFDCIKLDRSLSEIREWIHNRTYSPIAITRVVLEKVHAMPSQGVSSTFSFGESFGAVQMALTFLGGEIEYVSPRKWQQHFGLVFPKDSLTHTEKKNRHKEKAIELAPEGFKVTHATADALLIARYAEQTLGGG